MLFEGSNVFFSSRRRHTRWNCDWSSECALPIYGLVICFPSPRQRGQVLRSVKNPCETRTSPCPPQSGQMVGRLPAAAPLPWQSSQRSCRGNSTAISFPAAASSKEISTEYSKSAPRNPLLAPPPRREGPPKHYSKRSPKISPNP